MKTIVYERPDGEPLPVRVPDVGTFVAGVPTLVADEVAERLLSGNPCFRAVGEPPTMPVPIVSVPDEVFPEFVPDPEPDFADPSIAPATT